MAWQVPGMTSDMLGKWIAEGDEGEVRIAHGPPSQANPTRRNLH
jgi:hypothetical protein